MKNFNAVLAASSVLLATVALTPSEVHALEARRIDANPVAYCHDVDPQFAANAGYKLAIYDSYGVRNLVTSPASAKKVLVSCGVPSPGNVVQLDVHTINSTPSKEFPTNVTCYATAGKYMGPGTERPEVGKIATFALPTETAPKVLSYRPADFNELNFLPDGNLELRCVLDNATMLTAIELTYMED